MSRLLPFKSEPTQKPDGARVLPLEDEATDEALAALSSETARKVLALVYEEPMTPPEIRDEIETSLQNVHYHLENLEDAELIQPAGSGYSEKGTEMTVYAPASEAVVLFAGHERDRSRLQTALTRLLGAVGLLAVASYVVRRLGRTTGTGTLGLGGQSASGEGAPGGDAGAADTGAEGGAEALEETGDGGDGRYAGGDGGDGGGGGDAGAAGDATPTPDGANGDVGIFGQKTGTAGGDAAGTPTPAATEAPTETPSVATETAPSGAGNASLDAATATDVATAAADPASGVLADPAVTFFLGGLFMLTVVGAWWSLSR